MKKIFLLLSLMSASVWAKDANPYKDASSWSIMFGRNSLSDGKKQAEDLNPTGNSFKGAWAHRTKYLEAGVMIRYSKLTDDLEFEDIKGDFTRSDLTLGAQAGFWAFSWLKAHVGYAYHSINEKVHGNFSSSQNEDMIDTYRIVSSPTYGIFAGGDLVLIKNKTFQFFLNYDYYHLNGLRSHDWEAMAGIRIYLGPSKVGKGNFFIKLFRDLLAPKDK